MKIIRIVYLQWFGSVHAPFKHSPQVAEKAIKTHYSIPRGKFECFVKRKTMPTLLCTLKITSIFLIKWGGEILKRYLKYPTYVTKSTIPPNLAIAFICWCAISIDTAWKRDAFIAFNASPEILRNCFNHV